MSTPDEPNVPTNKLVRVFIKLRDKRAEMKRAFEEQDDELKGKQRQVENELLRRAQEEGVEGFKTTEGTTYISEEKHVSIADPDTFKTFLADEDDPYLYYEQRPSLGRIVEFQKGHDGNLPPGIRMFRENRMRVRAAKKGGGDAS